ncbi:hypothetical protein [Paenibacillus odorifer]|uniref:hypothetical protein n=1 Tax=Paenibacillus odorifer TaxID=189426 RepID=UPI00096D8D99|nr:hypothetical protein [Paenibacillus odorifer]OMD76847.1 hypothetical protein BSK50_13930 [Paenibacillus odorifer]
MPESQLDLATLEITDIESEAEYVEIVHQLFQGGDVTNGKIYEIRRMYYNSSAYPSNFLDGELYIVNDVGKDFFGVFNMCKTKMYKIK